MSLIIQGEIIVKNNNSCFLVFWGPRETGLRIGSKNTLDYINREYTRLITCIRDNNSQYVDPFHPELELDLYSTYHLSNMLRMCWFDIKKKVYLGSIIDSISNLRMIDDYYKDK